MVRLLRGWKTTFINLDDEVKLESPVDPYDPLHRVLIAHKMDMHMRSHSQNHNKIYLTTYFATYKAAIVWVPFHHRNYEERTHEAFAPLGLFGAETPSMRHLTYDEKLAQLVKVTKTIKQGIFNEEQTYENEVIASRPLVNFSPTNKTDPAAHPQEISTPETDADLLNLRISSSTGLQANALSQVLGLSRTSSFDTPIGWHTALGST